MTDKEKIIYDIEQESQKQGLSESALAKKAGLGQKRVNNLLSGKTKRLDYAVVDKLRGALGMVTEQGVLYTSDKPFQVVQEIGPETSKPSSPVVAAILGFVEAMSPEEQAAELKRLADQFTSSRTTEKS